MTLATKTDFILPEFFVYIFAPPGDMPELNGVFDSRIHTFNDTIKSFFRKSYSRWQLEQHTSQLFLQPVLNNVIEFCDQVFSTMKLLVMCNDPRCFYGKPEFRRTFFIPVLKKR